MHKVANVLTALPAPVQPLARKMLAEIRNAERHDQAAQAFIADPATSAPAGPSLPGSPGRSL